MCDEKKLISIVVPIYNEIAMVDEIYSRIRNTFDSVNNYDYEIVFFDDGSTDGTREAIEALCLRYKEVKAVFYSKNFGYLKNTFYCVQQAKGDCVIIIHADLQNPPELIPEFIKKWESGAQVVLGIKNKSKENKFVYFLRSAFYFLMINVFGVKLIAHATEFELFDRSFVEILKKIKTNSPFLRGIILEYATNIKYIYYTQDARKNGKSKFNLNKYYEFAICGITQNSTCLPRRIMCMFIVSLILIFLEFCFVVLPNLNNLEFLLIANAVILRCILASICVLGIVVCVLFEFIVSININNVEKPMVIEEKRIKY